jgi:RNase P subunit RPR2
MTNYDDTNARALERGHQQHLDDISGVYESEIPERSLTVICPTCRRRQDSESVTFRGIEEDMQGRDVLTFDCPVCGAKMVESLVFG